MYRKSCPSTATPPCCDTTTLEHTILVSASPGGDSSALCWNEPGHTSCCPQLLPATACCQWYRAQAAPPEVTFAAPHGLGTKAPAMLEGAPGNMPTHTLHAPTFTPKKRLAKQDVVRFILKEPKKKGEFTQTFHLSLILQTLPYFVTDTGGHMLNKCHPCRTANPNLLQHWAAQHRGAMRLMPLAERGMEGNSSKH